MTPRRSTQRTRLMLSYLPVLIPGFVISLALCWSSGARVRIVILAIFVFIFLITHLFIGTIKSYYPTKDETATKTVGAESDLKLRKSKRRDPNTHMAAEHSGGDPRLKHKFDRKAARKAREMAKRFAIDPNLRVVNLVLTGPKGVCTPGQCLARDTRYTLQVNIGGEKVFSIVKNPTAILKETVPSGGLDLRVVVYSKQFEIISVSEQPLTLPSKGETKTLNFEVSTPIRPGIAQLRVAIYYQQNVLQSLMMTAQVTRFERKRFMRSGLSAEVEYCLCGTLCDVEMYRSRDLNILTNESIDGTHTFAVVGTDLREEFSLSEGELSASLAASRQTLTEVCLELDQNKKPVRYRYNDKTNAGNLAQFTNDLAKLASVGWDLYFNFVTHKNRAFEERLRETVETTSTIQVATVKSAEYVFPWALVYDRPAQVDSRNRICPNFLADLSRLGDRLTRGGLETEDAKRALVEFETSSCLTLSCLHFHKNRDPTVICPGNFWGFRHRIEQPPSIPHEPGRKPEDVITHLEIKGDVEAVMGVSLKLNDPINHYKDIGKLKSYKFHFAQNKTEIFNSLKANPTSSVVYFYCHGGKREGRGFLGVGEDEQIVPPDLLAQDISWSSSHPLVFINGCRTADITPSDLLNFVRAFAWCQASGVIGTEINIFESLATEFATGLFYFLANGRSLGDAIALQRLILLSKFNPLGLAYTPYCYADLRFDFKN
jgi:hypothetical protein